MKKIISTIIALCMIAALFIIPTGASAALAVGQVPDNYKIADGAQAVTDETSFLAMAADGNYYLANDITLTKTYLATFTGTFDGCGHTVTVSAPIFQNVGGTVKNLTVNGEVTRSAELTVRHLGAVAAVAMTNGTAKFSNIKNNASVSNPTQDKDNANLRGYAYAAGIVGGLDNDTDGTTGSIEIVNCENNGNILGYHASAGIIGATYCGDDANYSKGLSVTITDCTNNGNVDSTSSYAGGIIGRVLYTAKCTVKGCLNTGDVIGQSNQGGIVGHTTDVTNMKITACMNTGDVSCHPVAESESVKPYAGGIIGYGQGSKTADFSAANGHYANIVEYCVNTGTITGSARTGGIIASSGADKAYGLTLVNYCVNLGNVTSEALGTSTASNAAGGITGYAYGSGSNEYINITNCVSIGNIESKGTSKGNASYFLGYTNSANAKIADCKGAGTLTCPVGTYSVGWNNTKSFTADSTGNEVAVTTYPQTYENGVTTNTPAATTFDPMSLLNGQYYTALNMAYMTAYSTTTPAFVLDTTTATITMPNYVPTFDTTGTTPDSPGTGDIAWIYVAVATVALLGVAVVSKKRRFN